MLIENKVAIFWLWTLFIVLVYHNHLCYWEHSGSNTIPARKGCQNTLLEKIYSLVSVSQNVCLELFFSVQLTVLGFLL